MNKKIISCLLLIIMIISLAPSSLVHAREDLSINDKTSKSDKIDNVVYKSARFIDLMEDEDKERFLNSIKTEESAKLNLKNFMLRQTIFNTKPYSGEDEYPLPEFEKQTDKSSLWTFEIDWSNMVDIEFPKDEKLVVYVREEDENVVDKLTNYIGRIIFTKDDLDQKKKVEMEVAKGYDLKQFNQMNSWKIRLEYPSDFRWDFRLRYVNFSEKGVNYYNFTIKPGQNIMPVYTIEWHDKDKSTREIFEGLWRGKSGENLITKLWTENNKYFSAERYKPDVVKAIRAGKSKEYGYAGDGISFSNDNIVTLSFDDGFYVGDRDNRNLIITKGARVLAAGSYIKQAGKENNNVHTEDPYQQEKDEMQHGEITFKNGTTYLFHIFGNHRILHKFVMREAHKVVFDANGAEFKDADGATEDNKIIFTSDKKKTEEQTIGHGLKLNDTFPRKADLTNADGSDKDYKDSEIKKGQFPAAKVPTKDNITKIPQKNGKDQEFLGWVVEADKDLDFSNGQNADKLVNPNGYEVKDNVTFYAVFGPKALGKVNVKYVAVDGANETEITDTKYHIDGQTYPAVREDKAVGTKIEATEASIGNPPKFIGYEFLGFTNGVTITPAAGQNETQSYTANAKYTITYKYKKLDPIIPAKDDNGNENPKATDDVKATYKTVTIKVDGNKGQFKKNSTVANGTEFVYYVNPVEGKTLNNVLTASGLTAESKNVNVYKIDTAKPWTFDPAKTKGNADVATSTEVTNTNFDKKNIDMVVNFVQTKADQLKDKLVPVDIRVWVDTTDTNGSKITWKNGVELNAANKDNETLKSLLAGATVTDLGENGTLAQEGTKRNSSTQNLPDGKKGTLKVAFDDGSALAVENQTLYVSPLKVPKKPDDDTNKIDPKNLPDDKVEVQFKLGEGVKIGDKNGEKTNPVLYETFYVKPGTDLDVNTDVPKTSLVAGYKDNKWYKGVEENAPVATNNDYKGIQAQANNEPLVFVAKATGKDKVVKLDNPENPTNFPKDPTDNNKKDADYVTVKFVTDANGKIKEGNAEKAKGIAYAVLKNTEWKDAVKAGVVVPTADAKGNAPKLVGKDKFHSFKEWQKDQTKVTTFPKVDADVTYTAVFGKANELTVTYNLNAPEGLTVGGTAPTDDTKYLKDEKVTVKALAADNTLAGYKFTGWNTQADGKGTPYAANAKFAIENNTELFAQWEKTAKDVIPVDNENDKKGKNDEEIPTNYVFVEFKVKDADADKAEIKANQQAKFKVDPKATVTLTAPELELKDGYKDSHIAKFNKDDYTNKKFAQATTIWAVVTEKGKVKVNYVFKTDPADKTLPKALADLKPTDITNPIYVDKVVDPDQPEAKTDEQKAALVEKDKDGKEVGTWTPGAWVKTGKVEEGLFTYTLTWTFTKPGEPYEYLTLTLDENYRGGRISDYDAYQGALIEGYLYRPHRRGYVFEGWSYNSRRLDEVRPGDRIEYSTILYAIWSKQKPKDDEEVEPIDTREVGEHKAYMFGYTDGTVRPNGYITRAEAAALVTRLLGLDTFASAAEPAFTDTPSSWYNKAINAAVQRGIMKGYPDGSFRPNAPITRAEFTQMISTIDNKPYGVAPFADVVGHWAERPIGSEYQAGRIKGYPDGTFRPNAFITRAEAVVILNKIFERNYDAMSAINAKNKEYIKRFIDLAPSFWGFNDMVEATNTHLFKRRVKGSVQEDWVEVK